MKRVASYALAAVLAIGSLSLVTAPPAGAAPGEPTLTAPADGTTVSANPVLAWSAVTGATTYRVQVSASASFTPLLVNVVTPNTKYGHPVDLPVAVLYWRVAAIDGSGQGGFAPERTFTKEASDGPVLSSPADGAALVFPTDPPVLSWQRFAGADTYQIQIDTEDTFTAPLTASATTSNSSYALTETPAIGQPFYWRVRAVSEADVPSGYSETRSYTYAWTSLPQLELPADNNDPGSAIEEVVFDWTPTPGAVTYDLQVSPDDQFTTLTLNTSNIHGTRYSPITTLDNGAYFWHVRARNYNGSVGEWSALSTFYRAWPAPDAGPNHRVTLVAPADGDQQVTVPEFRWTPVRLASEYQLQLGTDGNFSPGTFATCVTQHTTFIPTGGCDPDPGQTYFWRVRPIDGPSDVNGLFSATRSFQYDPGIPQPLTPADGAVGLTGPVTLTWAPIQGGGRTAVSKYLVTVLDDAGNAVDTATTYTTAYVPQGLDPADGPFDWYVQVVTASGQGNIPGAGSHFTFSFSDPVPSSAQPDPVTPDGTSGTTVPPLEWEPVAGVSTYEIFRATVPSNVYSSFKNGLQTNAYAHTGVSPAGSFTYYVRAYLTAGGFVDGDIGTFTVQTLGATTLQAPAHCPPNTACAFEPNTPTLQWAWNSEASYYLIYLAADPNFTNVLPSFNGVPVHYPRYRPTVHLPDAQAGQALYWYARPCKNTGACGAEPGTFAGANPPVRAFTKRSNPVTLLTPANEAPGATPLAANGNEITFDWEGYLATNLAAPGGAATDLEAQNYRVVISSTADMQTVVHTSPQVDQSTYTVFSATLPDGPLYWRVQAYDGNSQALSFSTTRLVHKRSPLVTLTAPSASASVSTVPVFRWASQPFAARYTLEVYRNPTSDISTGNRVINITTPVTAAISTAALPAGEYGWRVRRLDVDGRPGPWTADDNDALRRFTVAGDVVALLTPVANANFTNNNQSFTWTSAASATQYRFQADDAADFSSPIESVFTVMTSWHSTKVYPNGTYHWRVQTIDGAGNVTAQTTSRVFTHGPPPPPMDYFHPVTPARVLDSRPAPATVGPFSTPWGAGVTRNVPIAGFSGVPAGADAVTLNVTVTNTTAASFLKIWPKGQPETTASSLNWTAGTTIANSVTMTVGADESVSIKNQGGSTNVIIDVVGYYDGDSGTGGGLTSLTPKRILDTRPALRVGPYGTKFGAGTARDVQVAGGTTSVPANADAVVLNVTATGATAGSFLTIWPDGESQPSSSSLNFTAGQTIPNAVTTKVGTGGDVRIYNSAGAVDVLVDVVGYFEPGEGSAYRPLANPVRIQDSRPSGPQVGPYSTKWGGGTDRTIQAGGNTTANLPGNAVAVLLNVTVTGTTGTSFLTIYPDGATRPNASSLNWTAGKTIPNSVTAKTGTAGRIRAYNAAGSTDVLMDVFGYYGP